MNNLIVKEYLDRSIEFKRIDGEIYANATSFGESQKLADWKRSSKTKELIEELTPMENSRSLIISENGVGTWIHESLVLDFAQYISVKFRVWCQKQIATLIRDGEVSLKPKSEEDMLTLLFPESDKELISLTANSIREKKQLQIELKEERDYISHVVHNDRYYITPTVIGNKFGISARKLNVILKDLDVQYKKGKKWCLKSDYYGIGDYTYFEKPNGEWQKGTSLCYTNDGERVLYKLLIANGYEPIQ